MSLHDPILSIDESADDQQNDTSATLPTAMSARIAALTPAVTLLEKAMVEDVVSFNLATSDIAFTSSTSGPLVGVDSGLLSINGRKLFLYTDSVDNNLVIAREGTEAGAASATGAIYFAVYLEPNGTVGNDAITANLWVAEYGTLKHPDTSSGDDVVTLTGLLNISVSESIILDATKAPSGSSLFVAYGDGTPDPSEVGVIVTAKGAVESGNISGGNVVKASQAGAALGGATFGINSQKFDGPGGSGGTTGDAAYFTFVKGLATDLTVPNLDQNESDVESNIDFEELFNTTSVSFKLAQMQGPNFATVRITALAADINLGDPADLDDDAPWMGTDYIDYQEDNRIIDIDVVTITRGDKSWTFTEGALKDPTAPANLNVNFTGDSDKSAVISGAAEGDKITYFTVDPHNRLLIGAPGNIDPKLSTAFDIGALEILSSKTTPTLLDPIDFYDDGPSIGGVLGVIANGFVDFAKDDFDSKTLAGSVGADVKASPYTLTAWTGDDEAVSVAGVPLQAIVNSASTSVTYWADTSKDGTFGNAGDTAYYKLELGQAGEGAYTFTVLVNPPAVETNFTFADQPAGQNLFGIIATKKENVEGTPPNATLPDGGLLFFNSGVVVNSATGQYTNASSTVNTSKGGGEVSIGYGANNYTALGQDAYFVFVADPNTKAVGGLGLTQTTADVANTVSFDGTNETLTASVEIVKIVSGSPAGVTIKAYNLDPLNSGSLLDIDTAQKAQGFLTNPLTYGGASNDAEMVDIISVKIYNSNTTLNNATLVYSATDVDENGVFDTDEIIRAEDVTVVLIDGSLKVTGMDTNKNYTIRYDTETSHDMAEVEYVAGSYNIGGFNLIDTNPTADQLFDFTAKVVDGDGDTDTASWSVAIDGTGVWDDGIYTAVAPTGITTTAMLKDPGFVDDSGMFDDMMIMSRPQIDYLA